MTRELICVACPRGCALSVEMEGTEIISISGNLCPRGIGYARTEVMAPVRMFHSTVRVDHGTAPLVSVKSSAPVPKALLLNFSKETRNYLVKAPIFIGNIIRKNILNTGIDLVATGSVEALEA